MSFANVLYTLNNSQRLGSSENWWRLFTDTAIKSNAKGNLLTDAHIAAVAMDVGGVVITLDRDFSKFKGVSVEFLSRAL